MREIEETKGRILTLKMAGMICGLKAIALNALQTSTTLRTDPQDIIFFVKGLVYDFINQFLTTLTIGGVILIVVGVFAGAYLELKRSDGGGVS